MSRMEHYGEGFDEVEEYREGDERVDDEDEYGMMGERDVFNRVQKELAGGGLAYTVMDGELGKLMIRLSLRYRTAEERFRDNLLKISKDCGIEERIPNIILNTYLNKIKDVGFKSPAGILLGYMGKDFLNGDGSPNDIIKLQGLSKYCPSCNKHEGKNSITPIDIIRYARFWKLVMKA